MAGGLPGALQIYQGLVKQGFPVIHNREIAAAMRLTDAVSRLAQTLFIECRHHIGKILLPHLQYRAQLFVE